MTTTDFHAIANIAAYFEPTELKFRDSKHSFTGFVTEIHFDDAYNALEAAKAFEELIKHFVAMRVVSETACYISVPTEPEF